MSGNIFKNNFRVNSLLSILIFSVFIIGGCTVEAAKNEAAPADEKSTGTSKIYTVAAEMKTAVKGRITVAPNSPADTLRTFYKNLRERRFREAIFLTNLRPAIEGLTDAELKDLEVDFTHLAQVVPEDLQINGEIISGETATVTAKIPDDETGKLELKEFKLKREKGGWLILLVEPEAEAAIKKEGKNYFFTLRMEVHHSEAEAMMQRIIKAQMVFALQNGGLFGDMKSLIEGGLLPPDIQSADSTGYRYNLSLSSDKKKYKATAEPDIYNKTGKLSFLLEVEGNGKNPRLKAADNGGKPMKS